MDHKVLILNQDYSAISLCSVQRAFILLYLEKAEMLEKSDTGFLRSISSTFPKPSVIRLQRYVHIPYKGIALSRHNLMKRDQFMCQYCGSNRNLTLDHLMPRSRGGKSSWTKQD
jgi:5-methylcytosine-specific restriction endonuclease McrA